MSDAIWYGDKLTASRYQKIVQFIMFVSRKARCLATISVLRTPAFYASANVEVMSSLYFSAASKPSGGDAQGAVTRVGVARSIADKFCWCCCRQP